MITVETCDLVSLFDDICIYSFTIAEKCYLCLSKWIPWPNPRNKHHVFMRYLYVMPGCYGRKDLTAILVAIMNVTRSSVLRIVLLAEMNSLSH